MTKKRHSFNTKTFILSILFFGLLSWSFQVSAQAETATPPPAVAPAPPPFFTDIPENHAAYPAIVELKDLGVIGGFSDNTFRPDNTLTRAEAVTILLKASGKTGTASSALTTTKLSDVPPGAWFAASVQRATELEIVKGYADGTFKPNNPVTLAEAAKMIFSTFDFPKSASKTDGNWYDFYLAETAKKKMVDEKPKPDYQLKRAEFAQFVWRATKVKASAAKPFDVTLEWKTLRNEDSFFELKYPRTWEIFKGQKNSVLWKRDTQNGQIWFTRLMPLSERVSISFIQQSSCVPSQTKNAPRHFYDATICLGSGKTLFIYGDYGNYLKLEAAKTDFDLIIASIHFVAPKPPIPPPLTPEQKAEKAREEILVEGKGPEILKLFEDKKLLETDALGVGTGPVDYFYSQSANITIKYDRHSKTILDIRTGQLTKF